MVHFSLAVVLLASLSSAHFLLNYPPTIGFDDSLEGEGPCGSFTVDFSQDNVTDFNVGGSEIAVTSIHPQANWLFRATLGSNQNTTNWTQLIPIVQQTGLGDYCEKSIAVPASWAGQQGIISVVQDAPDGILYQCAAVNFVAGVGTPNSVCTNVTGLTAVFTTDATLESLNGNSTSSNTTSTMASTSATNTASTTQSSTSSSTSSKSAATSIKSAGEGTLSLVLFVGIASVVLVARLF